MHLSYLLISLFGIMTCALWPDEDTRKAKWLRRKARKRGRAPRLLADLVVCNRERNRAVHLMSEAHRIYRTQFTEDSSSDQRRLFTARKSLLNIV